MTNSVNNGPKKGCGDSAKVREAGIKQNCGKLVARLSWGRPSPSRADNLAVSEGVVLSDSLDGFQPLGNATDFNFRILGEFSIGSATGVQAPLRRQQERDMLMILLCASGNPVPAAHLANLLWPSGPPRSQSAILQTHASRIRSQLRRVSSGVRFTLAKSTTGFSVNIEESDLDLNVFLKEVSEAQKLNSRSQRIMKLIGALKIWRGAALTGATEEIRTRLGPSPEEARIHAIFLLAEDALLLGLHDSLVIPLTHLVQANPLNERIYYYLISALRQAGRRNDALTIYHQGCQAIRDELGIEPTSEMTALMKPLLDGTAIPVLRQHSPATASELRYTVTHQALIDRELRELFASNGYHGG